MAHRIAKLAVTAAIIAAPIAMTAAPAFAAPMVPGNNQNHGGPQQQGPGQQQHGPQQPGPQHNPAPIPSGSAA
ncbi:hypothetical protein [Nocardia alni]|uniref:hypothetical protein n=1 Tax=Nocardia alni TaxID=2815723 RepID=UPI001C24D927|nr:hypothetical protein [Nocardia alni]